VSHIVEIKTEIRDPVAVAAACQRLGMPEPMHGTAKLFEGEAAGWLVKLPGWLYPIVIDTATASVRFDNFNGNWGSPEQLDHFLQAYGVAKAAIEARKQGLSVAERTLADGSILVTIGVGGAL
jgi:hypothetical protein